MRLKKPENDQSFRILFLTNKFIMALSEGRMQMKFLRSDANVLKIQVKRNDVVAIWGKLKFKQSFTILEKSVQVIPNIFRVDFS